MKEKLLKQDLIGEFCLQKTFDISVNVYLNGKWTCIYIALFQCTDHSKCFTVLATFSHSHTYSYTNGRGCHARCQLHIRSNLGFSILLKDTSTCSSAQPEGAEIRTSNILITRQPALPPVICCFAFQFKWLLLHFVLVLVSLEPFLFL